MKRRRGRKEMYLRRGKEGKGRDGGTRNQLSQKKSTNLSKLR